MAQRTTAQQTIADDLREKLQQGIYERKLPSTGKIAQQYGVTRQTAMHAIRTLRDEGLVDVVQGSGVYVAGTVDRLPLVEQFLGLLCTGLWPVGSTFPSEKELCESFEVSRQTVRTALAHLEGRGLLSTNGGRARVVLALPDKEDND